MLAAPLATSRPYVAGKIQQVKLLGSDKKLSWKQDETGLTIQLPAEKPYDCACALKIEGLET